MRYYISDLDIKKDLSLYARSLEMRLRYMEQQLGFEEEETWINQWDLILDEIDYDNLTYEEQAKIDAVIDKINRKFEWEYHDGELPEDDE